MPLKDGNMQDSPLSPMGRAVVKIIYMQITAI